MAAVASMFMSSDTGKSLAAGAVAAAAAVAAKRLPTFRRRFGLRLNANADATLESVSSLAEGQLMLLCVWFWSTAHVHHQAYNDQWMSVCA